MRTVSIISQKGGAGKTTFALNLAIASERAGHACVLVDIDPQASAAAWGDSREAETPVVVSAQAARLAEVLATALEHGAKLCIIDTAPHAQTDALRAARAADLVLVPCRPSVLDLRAIGASADVAALARTPAVAVLCGVPPRGPLADEAEEALRGAGLDVAPVRIGHRAAFVHAATAGAGVLEHAPGSRAAEEMHALYGWVVEAMMRFEERAA